MKKPNIVLSAVVGTILLILALVIASSVGATGTGRENACRTYNIFAHQGIPENGVDSKFCGTSADDGQTSKPKENITIAPAITTGIPSTSVPTEFTVETPLVTLETPTGTPPPPISVTKTADPEPWTPVCKDPPNCSPVTEPAK